MKSILKPAVVSLLSSRPVATIADPFFHSGVPIFMLHRVSHPNSSNKHTISSDHLRKCLDYLVDRNYTLVSMYDLVNALKSNKKLPLKSAVFTIDDGYIDQAQIAAPIALEYCCPVTFFIITGMLDQLLWPWDAKVAWIIESSSMQSLESSPTIKKFNFGFKGTVNKKTLRRSVQETLKRSNIESVNAALHSLADDVDLIIPSNPPSDFQPMTWDMARSLENQGIHFAPHSTSHNILSKLDQSSMEQEILNSWDRVKNELSNPLKIFCYPNGKAMDFGEREITFLKDLGFAAAVSTRTGVTKYKINSDDYVYSLPRLPLPDNMAEFIKYCSWIERAREFFK